jgi:DUF2075 family protein/SOS-response transcriptional repressor LexA
MNGFSGFTIDISEFRFSKEAIPTISENIWVKNQWPLVYFIRNEKKKKAYVGESTNGFDRITTHLNDEQKAVLDAISIIGCDVFNKSATLDLESRLIQYISSEGSYELQNGNNGLSYHNYYQRDLYGDLFKTLWEYLLDKKIVSKSLKEIRNSNFFKYSPYKSLNNDQYSSVLEIIQSLNTENSNHIFVRGTAGTGKTILATYLIKLLTTPYEQLNAEGIDNDHYRELELMREFKRKYPAPSIALVIAMTSLRETLQNVFDSIPGLNRSMVISPTETFRRNYDILIVDEAHRLRQRKNISWMGVFTQNNSKVGLGNEGTELNWIVANSKHQIFFYDTAQSVKPSDVPSNDFEELLHRSGTIQLELKSQMRVEGGEDYIAFVDQLLNCRLETETSTFKSDNYDLKFFDSMKELYAELKKKEEKLKLCRLIAGYSWPWLTKKKDGKHDYDIELDGLKFKWNRTDKDWIGTENSFKEIGCIHTTQGYDLNYAGIIFGKEISYNPQANKIEIIASNYFDRNGKAGLKNEDDLKNYIINIYKTMMYRGIKGVYVYACDTNLRHYLKKHIPVFKGKEAEIISLHTTSEIIHTVPLYDIRAAAGGFSEKQLAENAIPIELPEKYPYKDSYFAIRVSGSSMNKIIPDDSLCLFEKDPGGSREGKTVLVEQAGIQDRDFGSGYTVKVYHSKKVLNNDRPENETIILKPHSYHEYPEIILTPEQSEELRVIGVFVGLL